MADNKKDKKSPEDVRDHDDKLTKKEQSKELDNELDDSMDGSDPPSITQP